jgi:hypothetical protein
MPINGCRNEISFNEISFWEKHKNFILNNAQKFVNDPHNMKK